nr:hypothetical protein [Candidatus Sigynarchaeum springense]
MEAWTKLKLSPIDHRDVTVISTDGQQGRPAAQFSFAELLHGDAREKVEQLKLFLRSLPEASEHVFDEIATMIFTTCPGLATFQDFRKAFEREMAQQKLSITSTLTRSQQGALIATLYSDADKFFDQPGQPFNLAGMLQPGKVIVFDLKRVEKDKVILYVLSQLQWLKFEAHAVDTPVIVVIDEAHQVFKRANGSAKERRYYDLISKYLAKCASRGRKHKLGLWLASQRPQDLHPDVNLVIVNHFILGLNPEHKTWLAATLADKVQVDRALELPSAYALFRSAQLRRGRPILLRLPRAPNEHKTFV